MVVVTKSSVKMMFIYILIRFEMYRRRKYSRRDPLCVATCTPWLISQFPSPCSYIHSTLNLRNAIDIFNSLDSFKSVIAGRRIRWAHTEIVNSANLEDVSTFGSVTSARNSRKLQRHSDLKLCSPLTLCALSAPADLPSLAVTIITPHKPRAQESYAFEEIFFLQGR